MGAREAPENVTFIIMECQMPEKETIERAKEDAREGKSASTQAGEFVRQEMDHIREGKHGARSTKQAIAIGLSEARRAGIKVKPSPGASASTRRKAEQDVKAGSKGRAKKTSTKRSKATRQALKREPTKAASKSALSRHAKKAAARRSSASRSASAKRAATTRKREQRSRAR